MSWIDSAACLLLSVCNPSLCSLAPNAALHIPFIYSSFFPFRQSTIRIKT
jgi:hypothetical protein